MELDEFWEYTPRLFQLKLQGKQKAEMELQRGEWERMRYQTVCLINKDRKRSEQLKLKDLVHFDWEKKTNKKSDFKAVQYLLAKANKNKE